LGEEAEGGGDKGLEIVGVEGSVENLGIGGGFWRRRKRV
jgi:hypothetical protein